MCASEAFPYRVCQKCEMGLPDNQDDPVKGGSLGYQLYLHMRDEYKILETEKTLAKIKAECNAIMDSLQYLAAGENKYYDAYVD